VAAEEVRVAMAKPLKWTDVEDIAILLFEKHP